MPNSFPKCWEGNAKAMKLVKLAKRKPRKSRKNAIDANTLGIKTHTDSKVERVHITKIGTLTLRRFLLCSSRTLCIKYFIDKSVAKPLRGDTAIPANKTKPSGLV